MDIAVISSITANSFHYYAWLAMENKNELHILLLHELAKTRSVVGIEKMETFWK